MTDKESDNDNYDPFSDPVYMALRKSYKEHTSKGPDYKCGEACHHDNNESKDIFLAKWYGLLSSKDPWGGLERLFEHGFLNRDDVPL